MVGRVQPTYPLVSWRLRGFRSIRDETAFELAGLNILVGANSAGKSSVLHSLLMTAQTLGNPLADRPLILNGHLVRLGLASDTVHEEAEGAVGLGFSLIPAPQSRKSGMWYVDFDRVDVDTALLVSTGGDFDIDRTTVTATHSHPELQQSRVLMTGRSKADAETAYRQHGLLRDFARKAAQRAPLSVSGTVPPAAVGVTQRQFLPHSISLVVNENEQELFEHLDFKGWRYRRALFHDSGPAGTSPMSSPVREFVEHYVNETISPAILSRFAGDAELSMQQVMEAVPQGSRDHLRELAASEWYARHAQDLPFKGGVDIQELPPAIDAGLTYARQWFQSSVRYLGPLRAAPQPLYGLPEAASGTSVGREGEYTAAVLSAHSRRPVTCPKPDGTGSTQMLLSDAVNTWMTALGLLSSVRSEERGKLGYELHLSVEGVQRDLDLTTVGVGVSQALPIVVLGLVTQPGSLLLFEQPELHLHPDVQASLGDFFLALARSGRQLIVETHSEYLINRLRRRAATDPELGVADQTRFFFFERSGSTATVRTGRIGSDGSTSDWPRGFLDTAAREVQAIAKATST